MPCENGFWERHNVEVGENGDTTVVRWVCPTPSGVEFVFPSDEDDSFKMTYRIGHHEIKGLWFSDSIAFFWENYRIEKDYLLVSELWVEKGYGVIQRESNYWQVLPHSVDSVLVTYNTKLKGENPIDSVVFLLMDGKNIAFRASMKESTADVGFYSIAIPYTSNDTLQGHIQEYIAEPENDHGVVSFTSKYFRYPNSFLLTTDFKVGTGMNRVAGHAVETLIVQ